MKLNSDNFDSVINNNLKKQFLNYSKKKNENKIITKGINKLYKNNGNKNLNYNNIRSEQQKSVSIKSFVTNNNNNNYSNNNNNNYSNSNNNKEWIDLNKERLRLPISNVRNKIIDVIKKCSTVIIIGETGCGKTTQIPQYLFEANFVQRFGSNGLMIAITQPRRVAAITIADRVAQEMRSTLGSIVGYSVRFEDMTSPQTKIKYLTDGTLLREAISDPLLQRYKVVILDEAHERTIQTDVLFGVIKKAQQLRKDKQMTLLKVIIMSATMDCDHFSDYFNKAPVYYILGRQHSIQVSIKTYDNFY
jgi:ATP-dependent RNA helicase DHX33